jgi:prevent-host-death family protein
MRSVDIEAAETDFLGLLKDIERGEEVIITRDGKPVAKLVPSEQPVRRRQLGHLRGKAWAAPDAWDPDPELERLFYEGDPNFRSVLDDYIDELAEREKQRKGEDR